MNAITKILNFASNRDDEEKRQIFQVFERFFWRLNIMFIYAANNFKTTNAR